jgi:uncharacterized protein YgbK (DUF1537 family)
MSTSVLLGTGFRLKSSAKVLVLDTETRNKTETQAYVKVRDVCLLCRKTGFEIVYKKIDSSLRGNLGAELRAFLDVFRRPVLVCPAYPEQQRSMVNGHLLIRGVPVDKTKFARDPVSPVRTSDIGKIIAQQINEKVAKIPLISVRKGSCALTRTIRRYRKRGLRIICADAENRTDLKNIASACLQSRAMPCGSAGLAEEVAATLRTPRPKIMVLSSSTNEATLKELQRSARDARTFLIRAKARTLLGGNSRRREISRIRRLAEQGLESHEIVIVCSALYQNDFDPHLISQASRWLGDPIASGLAAAIFPLALSGIVDRVLLTGGEMAAAFLKSIQASELRLVKEILPGIPLSTVVVGRGSGLKVVTKAGGFGARGSMNHILDYLISE